MAVLIPEYSLGARGRSVSSRPRALACAIFSLLVLSAGCSDSPGDVETPSADGPLSANAGSGGNGLYPPPGARDGWRGTFGGFVLCSESGAPITIDHVRWDVAEPPKNVAAYLRTVNVPEKPDQDVDYLPLGSALGAPPSFTQPYAQRKIGGSFSDEVTGTVVDQTCEQNRTGERDRFTELVFVLDVGRSGGRVTDATVEYTAEGKQFILPIQWQMVACGTAIADGTCDR